jgi:magnesium transporter
VGEHAVLIAYQCQGTGLQRMPPTCDVETLRLAAWIDLVAPTPEEVHAVEQAAGLTLPSEEALSEIETSSRLNVDDDVLTLSMPLISREGETLHGVPGGFVLSPRNFVTIRFAPHAVFDRYADRELKSASTERSSGHLFVGLMEALVDRQADGLEQLRTELDALSANIFRTGTRPLSNRQEDRMFRDTLGAIGRAGYTISLIRDSQVAAARIVPFVEASAAAWLPKDLKPRLRTLRHDIASLNDYDTHLNDKLQFLLDATLGFINIAQNNVMKVMTVASVVGIPPVLVAGIYGMNFKIMPELEWAWGYPYGLILIVITGLIPLAWFKWRDWI